VFAPKASRVVRFLLSFPRREWRTTDVAGELAIDPGYVSRMLTKLQAAGYVTKDKAWHLARPQAMLDDWAHSYRFERHDIEAFFSLTPRVEARMNMVLESAKTHGGKVAFSGAAAAGLWGAPSAVDEVVAFVEDAATRVALVNALGVASEVDAPNLLLVVPDDLGVFMPVETRDALPLVCRPQVYLDVIRSVRGRSLAPHLLETMPWSS
jgi:hypothetical protein